MHSIFLTLLWQCSLMYALLVLACFLKAKWLDGPDGTGICSDYLRGNLRIVLIALAVFIITTSFLVSTVNSFTFERSFYSFLFWIALFVSAIVAGLSWIIAVAYSVYSVFVFKKTMHRKIRKRLEAEMDEDDTVTE